MPVKSPKVSGCNAICCKPHSAICAFYTEGDHDLCLCDCLGINLQFAPLVPNFFLLP